MPKQLYKIVQFHGGLNSNSDARDIAENELSEAVDIMVDELGKIRLMGGTSTSSMPAANAAVITAGYGLFHISHDRTGGELKVVHSGTYTHGSDSGTVLIDSAAAFTSGLVGGTAYNLKDDSSGTVVSVDSSIQLTVDDLTGGTDDLWDASEDDEYVIGWPQTGDNYLVMADTDGAADLDIYSRVASGWGTAKIDLGDITGMKPVFYIVDGALRACDGDFGNNNTNQWYGYIHRTHFSGLKPSGYTSLYSGWYAKDAALTAPPTCLATKLDGTANSSGSATTIHTDSNFGFPNTVTNAILSGNIVLDRDDNEQLTLSGSAYKDLDEFYTPARTGGNWDGIDWALFPKPGEGFHLNITAASGSTGNIPAGNYIFGITYIYDAEPGDPTAQESFPVRSQGGGPDGTLFLIEAGETTAVEVFATSPYDPRITGGRVYWRKLISGAEGDWIHLLDISLRDGVRQGLFGAYDGWSTYDSSASTICLSAESNTVDLFGAITWEDLNFMPQDSPANTAKYKTALIANRIAYIGNVRYNGITYGDAVFKSPVNKFDIFTDTRKLEASINDGDEIIKLENYADRLLIFKKHKLELLNISQDVEFLEDTFMHKGVSHPAATCKTDFGIAWVNEEGCYLYDGQRVNNLLEKQGRQIIKESDWNAFVFDPIIGYFPKKRQLIVADDAGVAGTGVAYLYDMVTQSWVKSSAATFPDADSGDVKTNFVTDWNNDLIFAYNTDVGTVVKWDDAVDASSYVNLETKDIDFGQPGQLKNIYKVYLTYRGVGTDVRLHYGVDGLPPTLTFNSITSGTDGSSTGSGTAAKSIPYDAGVTDWLKAELKPSAAIRNINSFRLKLSGDGSNPIAANFEINDITIVFRLKGQR